MGPVSAGLNCDVVRGRVGWVVCCYWGSQGVAVMILVDSEMEGWLGIGVALLPCCC